MNKKLSCYYSGCLHLKTPNNYNTAFEKNLTYNVQNFFEKKVCHNIQENKYIASVLSAYLEEFFSS